MVRKSQLEALDAGLREAGPDLNIPSMRILIAVAIQPHLSIIELARKLGIRQQTVSRYVAYLQGRYQTAASRRGFAREPLLGNRPDWTDGRRYELVLTPTGAVRLDAILKAVYVKGIEGEHA
jgi:DNA-binding MarR family transcriptional regulator